MHLIIKNKNKVKWVFRYRKKRSNRVFKYKRPKTKEFASTCWFLLMDIYRLCC